MLCNIFTNNIQLNFVLRIYKNIILYLKILILYLNKTHHN